MNTDIIKGKWMEVKGEILNKWGKLTDSELDQTKGNITSIAGLIQQRYGDLKEDVSAKLNDIFERGKEAVADKSEQVKENVRRDSEFQPREMPEQPKNDPLLSKDNFHA